ncbi:MAG: DEAD/DEAH box helicase, partial [Legionellales bacterium]|nr:DEAD/DEAH box helicase [Legionellales bacterium]
MKIVNKELLLTSARSVYLSYAALHFFKTRSLNEGKSLFNSCLDIIKEREESKSTSNAPDSIIIDGQLYKLTINATDNDSFQVTLEANSESKSSDSDHESLVKKIRDYSDCEVAELLASQPLTIKRTPSGQYTATNQLMGHTIGGPGKIDLYTTHLVTLHNIITKIDSEEDITNLLVALATGSGKTYVQALWMLVLTTSGNHGVFAIPDKLVKQFQDDLRRLLPDALVDGIDVIREDDDHSDHLLNSLSEKTASAKLIVASSERLLDGHYQKLLNADSERIFLSFDEQHLIMQTERRRVRLLELSKKRLSMFLTATPNEETYKLSGCRPVAIMSSGQKQEAGQGQFPELYMRQARNMGDRNKLRTYRFWRSEFWRNLKNSLLLKVMGTIEPDRSSAASSMVETLPFHIQKNQQNMSDSTSSLRWGMEVPAARKILCLIEDGNKGNESLINLCYALGLKVSDIRKQLKIQRSRAYKVETDLEVQIDKLKRREQLRNVYVDGNVRDREEVEDFLEFPPIEWHVTECDKQAREQQLGEDISAIQSDDTSSHQAKQSEDKKENDEVARLQTHLSKTSLLQHLKSSIFHNLIEYVLMDITELDEIDHNQLRKKNFDIFYQMVIDKYEQRNIDYYQKKLAGKIGAQTLERITLIKDISELLTFLSNEIQILIRSDREQDLKDFIDNWPLSGNQQFKTLKEPESCSSKIQENEFIKRFAAYADKYAMVAVMTNMGDSETPIADSQPFAGMIEDNYRLYDEDTGILSERAKQRPHTSLETLNPEIRETAFRPDYLSGLSEETCDVLFRLGFIGMYVSNKKTEGFNDPHLHTVISIAEQTASSTNNPSKAVQGMGRNRGLDDQIKPAYFQFSGRDEKPIFNLHNLKLNDYYPRLFRARKRHNKHALKQIGKEVEQKIMVWIDQHLKKDQTLDPEHLKRQVLKYVTKALREINNQNGHRIKYSRVHLAKVIKYTMQKIDKTIDRLKHPHRLSLMARSLGSVLYFMSYCRYSLKRIFPTLKLIYHSWARKINTVSDQLKRIKAQLAGRQPQAMEDRQFQRAIDTVYTKIIRKLSFKEVTKYSLSMLEIKHWLFSRISPSALETLIAKDLEYYLKTDVVEKLKDCQKEAWVPLILKMITDEKKSLVEQKLSECPKLLSYIHVNQTLLSDIFTGESANSRQALLLFLQKISGLETLTIDGMVDYPSLEAVLVINDFEDKLKTLEGQKQLVDHSLKVMLTDSDYTQVANYLAVDRNFNDFIGHIISADRRLNSNGSMETINLLLPDSLRSIPDFADLKTLDERMIASEKISKDEDSEKSLESARVIDLISERCMPILLNKDFVTAVDNLTGFLNKADLTILLGMWHAECKNSMEADLQKVFASWSSVDSIEYYSQVEATASQLIQFIQCIKRQDKQTLRDVFFKLPTDEFSISQVNGLANSPDIATKTILITTAQLEALGTTEVTLLTLAGGTGDGEYLQLISASILAGGGTIGASYTWDAAGAFISWSDTSTNHKIIIPQLELPN